ncbi:hypothetical protein TTMY_2536 [Thermus thermophilus]|uniref:DUF4397 domain-containing protein n=1 Tax=Thermus thermophilus TaxID=274 RepID=UPI00090C8B95|nr:DUF4397 domain-containing protein [Thermus thermophilus]BAW02897.1 hypothetical protein TTMY_2536 [Thermus thermophilus]BDB11126.1 hypothetical protein TthTMY_08650 [Thermus thermophilus]
MKRGFFAMVLTGLVGLALGQGAMVRVAHLSPDAPAVDVLVNGQRAITGLAFKEVTPYLPLPAAKVRVQVVPAGQDAPVVMDAELDLKEGVYYTVAATGFLAQIRPQVYTDLLAGFFPRAGYARIRVVHASPDAPAVDVAVKGGPVLFAGLPFPQASPYLSVAAGTYDLEVRAAGTDTVALSLPGVELEPGKVYTVFAVGSLKEGTLTVVPVVDATALGGNR